LRVDGPELTACKETGFGPPRRTHLEPKNEEGSPNQYGDTHSGREALRESETPGELVESRQPVPSGAGQHGRDPLFASATFGEAFFLTYDSDREKEERRERKREREDIYIYI
jgi:hypothetical protein